MIGKINVMELTAAHRNEYITFESLATDVMAEKFRVPFAEKFTGRGMIRYIESGTASLTRGAKFVTVMVTDINGHELIEPIDHEFVWGAHVDIEIIDYDAMIAEMRAELAPTPNPVPAAPPVADIKTDDPVHPCGLQKSDMPCDAATWVGLDRDSKTKIPVCDVHSRSSRWWGVWPIKNDSFYGRPIRNAEIEHSDGKMSRPVLDAIVDEVANFRRKTLGAPTVTLHKSDPFGPTKVLRTA